MITLNDLKKYTEELSKKITFNTENLYIHTISLNADSGKRIVFDIINENANDMTLAEVKKYIKDNYSASSADVLTYARFMPCVGVASSYPAVGFAWATNRGGWVIVYPVSGGLDWSGVNDGANIFILAQKTRTLALNNVLKPSMREYDTKLSLAGTAEAGANVHWTLLKTPVSTNKFLYKWTGHYLQTKNIAITNTYGSVFMSGKIAIEVPDSKILNKAIISARQSGSTSWVAGSYGGSTLDFYLLRATSATITNSFEINIQAEYIDS